MAVQRTVNMQLVNKWKRENAPMAAEKMAVEAQVTPRTAVKLFKGIPLGQNGTRFRVASVLGVPEHILFPVKETRKRTS